MDRRANERVSGNCTFEGGMSEIPAVGSLRTYKSLQTR